jgi:hypothetical protein
MSNIPVRAFSTLAAVLGLMLPANAQSVISTRAGLIDYFEGPVYLGDQPLESRLGKFPSVPEGAILRTEKGRAEVQLTPGVFLRMGQRTAIRMIANSLADTRVELQAGSAFVDSGEPNQGTSVTLLYKNWRVHVLQKGVYRIDADPARLWVRTGEAEVFAGTAEQPIPVEAGTSLPFASVLVADRSSLEPNDALSDWANGRSQSISADNAITAQIDEDPSSATAGLDDFTYYPLLGISSLGLGSGLYGSLYPAQPGFNSVYLPGYTYAPVFLLGLGSLRLQTYRPLTPLRIGSSPGLGGIYHPLPRGSAPILVHPSPIRIAPIRIAPTRAAPPVVMHGIGHR